jgi:hypothetical protein
MSNSFARIVRGVFQDMERLGHVDLEASEMAIRASSHQIGGRLLEKLLNADGGGYRGARTQCSQGHRAETGERSERVRRSVSSRLLAICVARGLINRFGKVPDQVHGVFGYRGFIEHNAN